MRGHRLRGSALALFLAFTGCAWFTGEQQQADVDQGQPGETPIPYTVAITGEMSDEVRAGLMAASRSAALAASPPTTELTLERRAETDLPRLQEALRGLAFYDGSVRYEILPAPAAAEGVAELVEGPPTATIRFIVETGQRYLFDERQVVVVGEADGFEPPTPSKLGLEKGQPAIAQLVLDAEQKLLAAARDSGHALARIENREAVVDHDQHIMNVTLRIAPGPLARFGEVRFEGADSVDDRYLQRVVPVRQGSKFKSSEVDRGRDALGDTGLFSNVTYVEGKELDPEGQIPITYQMTERLQRSIGGGVGYVSDEGPNANVFWEHRNFFGAGERLRAEITVSPVTQEASLDLRKPAFFDRDLTFLASATLLDESTDAYDSVSAETSVGLERKFKPGLTGSLGIAYRYVDINDREGPQNFGLLSLPGTVDWDFSDNRFDPSKGGRLQLTAAPYVDLLDTSIRFAQGKLVHTRYVPLMNSPKLVFAARGAVGATTGAEREDIPADVRFYAGGAGSIRGVPLMKAGPLDRHDDPVGGRSLLEVSAELRLAITESIGVVAFLDGGSAYEAVLPDPSSGMRWGAGGGLRYMTPVGPLRLDIGVPVDRNSQTDDAFQVYLSLGQAF